jgi:hypothetical protein
MTTLIRQLALVSESDQVPMNDVLSVSAALQKQASRDLGPIWDLSATVDAFEKLEDVPLGYWPMIVRDDIGVPGAAGIHEDKDGQPFALITAGDIDTWSLTASHETCEMLVDPFGNRLIAGDSPADDQGRVMFLVEVADPSEAADFGYSVNGILVSDFYTPNYFDPIAAPGVRYSFTGSITEPRQVLPGGYLSWKDPVSDHWWQEIWFDGDQPSFRDIGVLDQKQGNARSLIDRITNAETAKAAARGRKKALGAGLTATMNGKSTTSRAMMWRQEIGRILNRASKGSADRPAAERRPTRRTRPSE